MDLKNALSVCLIALFSSALVVLIARSLDSQAASRLEPQLARIAFELEAIRSSGGMTGSSAVASQQPAPRDGLIVYYFHSNKRCPTCEAIESQTHDTVRADFAPQLQRGELTWKTLNYQRPEGSALAAQFEIEMSVVVLARIEDSQVAEWKRLDQVWGLVNDQPAFAEFIRDEISLMLGRSTPASRAGSSDDASDIPLPADDDSDGEVPGETATLAPLE